MANKIGRCAIGRKTADGKVPVSDRRRSDWKWISFGYVRTLVRVPWRAGTATGQRPPNTSGHRRQPGLVRLHCCILHLVPITRTITTSATTATAAATAAVTAAGANTFFCLLLQQQLQ